MIRVIKLGGSLLDLADLPHRFQAWIASEPPSVNVVVVGGGPVVDGLRTLHAAAPMDDTTAHWLCIEAMSVTAEWMAARLGWPVVEVWDELLAIRAGGASGAHDARLDRIFKVESWLRKLEPTQPGAKLPIGWHVTSDSIAARLATTIEADELVLLKSCPKETGDWNVAAANGYVDRWFPTAVARIQARAVDFNGMRCSTGGKLVGQAEPPIDSRL